MATTRPTPGREEDLDRAALEHAAALRQQPGCVGAFVMHDRVAGTQVSVSIFRTREEFDRALEATRPVIARHGIERMRSGDTTFTILDVL